MKLMYTQPVGGGISIVIAVPKPSIERDLGRSLTKAEYEAFILNTSIPEGALNVKTITSDDIPTTRKFRGAWSDITADTKVNIDVAKVKDLKLLDLRKVRDKRLMETDIELIQAIESSDVVQIAAVKAKRTALRDATEELKAVAATGVVDDLAMIALIEQKAELSNDLK